VVDLPTVRLMRRVRACSRDRNVILFVLGIMHMKKVRVTISLDPGIAEYIRSAPNGSALVAEAVEEYRARVLERELEDAYREDAAESARLHAEWAPSDAEITE
jgi:hypothetical protein